MGKEKQIGDVEAVHRGLEPRLEQALLVRGNRDFADRTSTRLVEGVLRKANAGRGPCVAEEIEATGPLVVERLPEYSDSQFVRGRSVDSLLSKYRDHLSDVLRRRSRPSLARPFES